jgi:hypothetical protein
MASRVRDTDRGMRALLARVRGARLTLTVGVHGEEGGASHGHGLTVGDIATIHEYGLGVPERSFIRAWADGAQAENERALQQAAIRVVKGQVPSAKVALDQVGLAFVGAVQARMAGGIPPPLAPATVARKGSSTPLIDTGQLRASIRHRVTP